jgi:hypothetical protein
MRCRLAHQRDRPNNPVYDLLTVMVERVPAHSARPLERNLAGVVGHQEIAVLLGVKEQTVRMWRQRDETFPEPTMISGTPLWSVDAIRKWATATGRS